MKSLVQCFLIQNVVYGIATGIAAGIADGIADVNDQTSVFGIGGVALKNFEVIYTTVLSTKRCLKQCPKVLTKALHFRSLPQNFKFWAPKFQILGSNFGRGDQDWKIMKLSICTTVLKTKQCLSQSGNPWLRLS